MDVNKYKLGQLVRVRTTTPFNDADSGEALDPDTVTATVEAPDGEVTSYVYGTNDELEKLDTGEYAFNIDANAAGVWHYAIRSTGNGQAADEGFFLVAEAHAVA